MTTTLVAPHAAARPQGPLTATGTLTRFALRRDRIKLPAWIAGISLTTIATAASFPGLYADEAARQARAAMMSNPAAIALGGPKVGIDDYTFGAMMTNEMLGWAAIFVALMAILAVSRHTRAEEETGRAELVLAAPAGRLAPLAAALIVAIGASVAVGLLTAVGLAALGLESIDWAGSLLYGAALAGVGAVFAAVTAITAQVSENSRGTSSLAGLMLGIAYALRAVGDAGGYPVLSWLSPIAWAQRTYAYVDNDWWPLLLSLGTTAALIAAAVALRARRDFGAGLRRGKPGPAHGSPALRSPLALALRLQRTALIAWVASVLVFGLVYGSLLGSVEAFASELEAVHDVLGGIADGASDMSVLILAFLSLLAMLLAMTASVYTILGTLRARAEEEEGRTEALLATPISRTRWLAGHALVGAAGGIAITLAGALGIGVSGALGIGDMSVLGDIMGAALVQSVPVVLIGSLAVALYGWVPRAAGFAWAVVVYAMFVGMLGGLVGLPQWSMDISPFAIVPMIPVENFTLLPVVGMLAVAAVLYVLGFAGFRRRDLRTGA